MALFYAHSLTEDSPVDFNKKHIHWLGLLNATVYAVGICWYNLAILCITKDRTMSELLAAGHDSELDTPKPWVRKGHNIVKAGTFEVQFAANSCHETPIYIGKIEDADFARCDHRSRATE